MNKNTKHARAKGYCSMKDMNGGGNKVYAGSKCDTRWDNSNSDHRKSKQYKVSKG